MLGILPQYARRRLKAGDITMVIGAQNIQCLVEAPLHLVEEIRDVRSEISRTAVFPDHHAVFLVTQFGGAKPGGAALLIQVAVFTQALDGVTDGVAFLQFPL